MAVAKCNQVDAPELELPPYRSVDRFVNVMLSFARQMESNQFGQLYKMMSVINENQYQRRPSYKPYKMDMYEHDMYNSDNKMDKFKMDMYEHDMYNSDNK